MSLSRKLKRKTNRKLNNNAVKHVTNINFLNYDTTKPLPNKTSDVKRNVFIENAMKQLRANDVANILSVNSDINANKSFNVLNSLTPNVKNVIEAYAIETGIDINDRQAMSIFAKITLGTLVNEYHIDELYGNFVKEFNKAFSTISLIEEMIVSRKDRYERLFLEIANKENTTEEEKKKLTSMSKAFSESYKYEEALEYSSSIEEEYLNNTEYISSFYSDIDNSFKNIGITLEKTNDISKVLALVLNKDEKLINKFILSINKYFDKCALSDEIDIIPLVRKFYFFDILIMLTRLKEDEIEHDFTKQLLSTLKDVLSKI